MKKIVVAFLIVIVCMSLILGIYNIKSIDSLMRPPKLSGESSLLQSAFEKTVSGSDGIVMKNPLDGEYTSSYLYYDLNNDGVEEAFVFYSDLVEDNMACVNIFKKVNDEWTFVSKIKGKSEEIYEISFADFNGDNTCEILLSWKPVDNSDLTNLPEFSSIGSRLLSIYNYNEVSTSLLRSELYSNYYIEDFNADNSMDLFLINISLTDLEKKTSGRILSFDENYSVVNDHLVSLTGMLDVYNIVSDSVIESGEFVTRIFVDGTISENGVITEVVSISHDSFEISLPLYVQNQSTQPNTLRDTKSFSCDIDGDGIVEIPTLEMLPHSKIIAKETNETSTLNLTVWNELSHSRLITDKKCVYNSAFKYMFIISEEFNEGITAIYDYNDDTLTFYEVNYSGKYGDELFTIKAFYTNNWESDNLDYHKFTENETYVYGCKFSDSDIRKEYSEYINDNFIII